MTLEELQAENKKLKAEVKRLKERNARWEDIKWNYEAILDQLSTDEVCEAKHELGLDYEDFDPDCDPSEQSEEGEE